MLYTFIIFGTVLAICAITGIIDYKKGYLNFDFFKK